MRQSDLKVRLRHCHWCWWLPVPGTGTMALSVGSCSGCGHNVPGPPSENLEEGGVGADGDAEAREGGQDDGDHGLHRHLLGLYWFSHSHSTAQLSRMMTSNVKQVKVREEHNEEELHRRVDPYVSPGHQLCCG